MCMRSDKCLVKSCIRSGRKSMFIGPLFQILNFFVCLGLSLLAISVRFTSKTPYKM